MKSRYLILLAPMLTGLGGCATIGSMMSPYSEKFSCKNDDHGQCIHPEKAYADAVNGVTSQSDPAVSRSGTRPRQAPAHRGTHRTDRADYQSSLYRELQGLIEAPVTPMLRPQRSIRTFILPYADRARPERLYMPRYVYSVVERSSWVVGDYLVETGTGASAGSVLDQTRDARGTIDALPEAGR